MKVNKILRNEVTKDLQAVLSTSASETLRFAQGFVTTDNA